jgi:hypothetical protein
MRLKALPGTVMPSALDAQLAAPIRPLAIRTVAHR